MGKIRGYLNLKPHKDASEQATNYVTDIGSNGIFVHPEGEGPDDTQTPTGWKIADAIELFRSGVSYIKAWIDSNVPKIRVGKEDGGHVVIQSGGMDVYGGDGTVNLSHIGYESGNAESGTNVAPYFTFGKRVGAIGNYSTVEGNNCKATQFGAHAEGQGTEATGNYAHAEGSLTHAEAEGAHAEGYNTYATDSYAHAEGDRTGATGYASHSEGYQTSASGDGSSAHGVSTKAKGYGQLVCGIANVESGHPAGEDLQWSDYGFIVGCGRGGSGSDQRMNAMAVDYNGNARLHGDVYVGCNGDSTGGNKVLSVANIRSGRFQSAQVSNGTYQDKVITFSPAFSSTPHVIACLSTDVTATQTTNLQVSVINISASGCTIRVANDQAGNRSPYIEWIAVGL